MGVQDDNKSHVLGGEWAAGRDVQDEAEEGARGRSYRGRCSGVILGCWL